MSESHPAWSPNGRKIAFTAHTTTDGQDDIWLMNPDGSAQTRLAPNPARDFGADWSPDGGKSPRPQD